MYVYTLDNRSLEVAYLLLHSRLLSWCHSRLLLLLLLLMLLLLLLSKTSTHGATDSLNATGDSTRHSAHSSTQKPA